MGGHVVTDRSTAAFGQHTACPPVGEGDCAQIARGAGTALSGTAPQEQNRLFPGNVLNCETMRRILAQIRDLRGPRPDPGTIPAGP